MRWEITVASCKQVRKEESVYTGFQHSFFTVCKRSTPDSALNVLHSTKTSMDTDKTIKSSSLKAEGTNDSAEPNPHGKDIKGQCNWNK